MKLYSARYLIMLFTILSSSLSYAGRDPVSWKLTPDQNSVNIKVGGNASAEYTLTNNISRPVSINTMIKSSDIQISYKDQCNQKVINPGSSCNVNVYFNPTTPSARSTFQLSYKYNNNVIVLPVWTGISSPSQVSQTGDFSSPNPFPSVFYTNQSPEVFALFKNTGNIDLTNCKAEMSIEPSSAATVSISNTSCGTSSVPVTISSDQSCVITSDLTSLSATSGVTLAAKVICDQITTPITNTFSVENTSGTCTSLNISPILPLSTETYKYADHMVKFNIRNTCTGENISLGNINISATQGSATITGAPGGAYDHCSGQSLGPTDSCDVMVSIIPGNIGPLKIEASSSNYPSQSGSTNTNVLTNQQSNHHILFINQCPFDVWYGVANGDGSNCPGTACKSPDPYGIASESSYKLASQVATSEPSTINLNVSSYQNGAFWPRTGCKMQNGQFNCITGTCHTVPHHGTCVSSGTLTQPQGPYTKFEANLLSTPGQDGVYDVSVINGMTVPVEVKGFGPSTGNTSSTVYNCSSAGALLQPASNNNLGSCTWEFNPESTLTGLSSIKSDFYWVTPGADSGCSDGINCGMSYAGYPASNGTSPAPINRRSGDFLGFNTLTNYAAYITSSQWGTRNLFTKYGMDKQIVNQTAGANYGTTIGGASIVLAGNAYPAYNTLLSVPGITNNGSLGSCYTPTNSYFAHCGGCVNWDSLGITLPSQPCGAGSSNYVDGMNNDWTINSIAAPIGDYTPFQAIKWLKTACPTAYSYQFDDPSSSFTCIKDGSTDLLTSYQVTFCPGGITGLPSGATEGRGTPPVG